jgi:hypothetical protein
MEIFVIMILAFVATIAVVTGCIHDRLVDILKELKKLNKINRGNK